MVKIKDLGASVNIVNILNQKEKGAKYRPLRDITNYLFFFDTDKPIWVDWLFFDKYEETWLMAITLGEYKAGSTKRTSY